MGDASNLADLVKEWPEVAGCIVQRPPVAITRSDRPGRDRAHPAAVPSARPPETSSYLMLMVKLGMACPEAGAGAASPIGACLVIERVAAGLGVRSISAPGGLHVPFCQ